MSRQKMHQAAGRIIAEGMAGRNQGRFGPVSKASADIYAQGAWEAGFKAWLQVESIVPQSRVYVIVERR